MLKKVVSMNWESLLLVCGVPAAVFALVQGISALALGPLGEGSVPLVSGILLPVVAAVVLAALGVCQMLSGFPLEVRLGQTRRQALGLQLGAVALEGVCSLGVCALLSALERLAAPGAWMALTGAKTLVFGMDGAAVPEPGLLEPGELEALLEQRAQTLFVEIFSAPWWLCPALLLGAVALALGVGAVLLRFGSRGGWVLWGIWMVLCFSPQLLGARVVTVLSLWPLLAAAGMLLALWGAWWLLRAPIRS